MSSFNFRMQRLLGYRHSQEEEAKRELGLRRVAMEEDAFRLNRLQREEEAVIRQWKEQLGKDIELPRLQLTQEYSRVLENRLLRQTEQHRRSKDRVEEQREVARQCWREKRMLELLKGKAELEHIRNEQVMERNLIDELVLNSYVRKGGDKK